MFYIVTTLSQAETSQKKLAHALWRIIGPISQKMRAETMLKKWGYSKNDPLTNVWKSNPDGDDFTFEATILAAHREVSIETADIKNLMSLF